MTTIRHYVSAALLVGVAVTVFGQGVVIIQHSGANSPLTEGWRGGGGYPVTNDLGVNAWSTPGRNNGAANYEYSLTTQQQASLANGWVFSVNARVATLNANPNYFGAVLLGTASNDVLLYFGSTASGDPLANLNYGPELEITNSFTLAGAGMTYNLYQFIYDSSSDMLSFWINGSEYATNVPAPAGLSDVIWQGGGSPQYTLVNWNLVSLEIVPEPSAVSLLFLGSGALVCLRLRRRAGKTQSRR